LRRATTTASSSSRLKSEESYAGRYGSPLEAHKKKKYSSDSKSTLP
jgi:hypothetical protein